MYYYWWGGIITAIVISQADSKENIPTEAPTTAIPTATPSLFPTSYFIDSVPGEEQCNALENGTAPIPEDRSLSYYRLWFDVSFLNSNNASSVDNLHDEYRYQLQTVYVPALVGCYEDIDALKSECVPGAVVCPAIYRFSMITGNVTDVSIAGDCTEENIGVVGIVNASMDVTCYNVQALFTFWYYQEIPSESQVIGGIIESVSADQRPEGMAQLIGKMVLQQITQLD